MINMPRADMLTVLRKLGLTTNLKLCLDAGHETSLPAASTKWIDLAGSGYDFFRGTTAGADATDPAINGTAGARSSSEYLSFDGGDYCLYDTTNETWMQNLHKDNALWTMMAWVYIATPATLQSLFGLHTAIAPGASVQVSASIAGVYIRNAGGGNALLAEPVGQNVAANTWTFLAVSVNEAAATGFVRNGPSSVAFTSTYTSPSAGSAGSTMEIAAVGAGNQKLTNGSRMASFTMHEASALSAAETLAVFQATRGKFGV